VADRWPRHPLRPTKADWALRKSDLDRRLMCCRGCVARRNRRVRAERSEFASPTPDRTSSANPRGKPKAPDQARPPGRRVLAGPSSRTAGDWDGEGGIGDPSLIFVTHRSLRKEGPMRGRPPLRKKGAYTAAERMRRYRQRRKTIATIGKDRRQAAAAGGTRGRPRRGDAQSGPGARRRALWRPLHRSAVGLPRLLTRHRHGSPRRQPLPR